jgi:hypothetical protein
MKVETMFYSEYERTRYDIYNNKFRDDQTEWRSMSRQL